MIDQPHPWIHATEKSQAPMGRIRPSSCGRAASAFSRVADTKGCGFLSWPGTGIGALEEASAFIRSLDAGWGRGMTRRAIT